MNRIVNKLTVAFSTFVLGVTIAFLWFSFNHSPSEQFSNASFIASQSVIEEVQIKKEELKPKEELESLTLKEAEKTILSYFKFSRARDFSKLKEIIVKSPPIYQESLERESEAIFGKVPKSVANENKQDLKTKDSVVLFTPSTLPLEEFDYEMALKTFPRIIYKQNFSVKQMSVKLLSEKECKIQVDLGVDGFIIAAPPKNFYLFKDESGKWKIFKIQ